MIRSICLPMLGDRSAGAVLIVLLLALTATVSATEVTLEAVHRINSVS